MFKRQVEAILKTVGTKAKGEWRVAHCLFHVPIDRRLCQEISPRVADRLYRLKNPTASTSEFVPCLEIRQLKFSESDIKIEIQQMEFRALPDIAIPGASVPGVEIRSVQAVRLKGAADLTLVVPVRFRFPVRSTPVMAKLLIEQLGQSVWLTFSKMQERLDLGDGEESIGQFANERAKARTGR